MGGKYGESIVLAMVGFTRAKGRGGGSFDLLALLAFLPSVISSFFTQNKGGPGHPRAPPLDPPLVLMNLT